jgi:hypothetical protein
MGGDQGDCHEIDLCIREKLGELKAMGMPLPEDSSGWSGTSKLNSMRIWRISCNARWTEGVAYLMLQALFISA